MRVGLFHPTNRNTQLIGVEFTTNDGRELDLYFSYSTIVAFRGGGHALRVSHNIWSSTTGHHLNEIDGGRKENRVDSRTFQLCLNRALEDFFSE